MSAGIFATTAPAYYAAGLPVIPLAEGQKRPVSAEWQAHADESVPAEVQDEWIGRHPRGNIGLVLGPQSGMCMIDIDTDDPELISRIREVLPPTPYERRGKKGVVLAYKWSGVGTFRIKDENGGSLVECLSARTQCVLPPSIHPDTGQPYSANCDLADSAVRAGLQELPPDIERRLRDALEGAGVALGRPAAGGGGRAGAIPKGPIGPGGRHTAGVSKAGEMARRVVYEGLPLLEAEAQTVAWCEANFTGPDAPDPAQYGVLTGKYVSQDSIVGNGDGPNPTRVLPYGWDEGMHAEEKRRRGLVGVIPHRGHLYAARHYIYVYQTGYFIDERTGEVMSEAAMLRTAMAAATDPHPQTRRVLDTITRAPGLRRVQAVVTRPNLPGGVVPIGGHEFWNDWRPSPLQPIRGVRDQEVWPFLRLPYTMFPDPHEHGPLLDWIAHLFQRPGVKVFCAPLLLSNAHGVGKGTLAGVIRDLHHSRHVREITPEVFTSPFNGYLKNAVFIFGDEMKSTDRMDVTNKAKTPITSSTVVINEKFKQPEEIPNICNFMFASNHPAPFALEQQDRRFFVLRIEDEDAARIKAEKMCETFHLWWADKLNRMRVLGWLHERDISGFRAKGHAPPTRAKEELLDHGRAGWEAWLTEYLEAGAGVFARDVATVEGIGAALARARHRVTPAQVREWCKRQGFAVLTRRWVPSAAEGERVKAAVYVVRDARRWLDATRDEVVAELSRSVDFETDKAQAERLMGGADLLKGNRRGK